MKVTPEGRAINEEYRHLTIAFLGNVNWELFEPALDAVPVPGLKVGLTGMFDQLLFLPPGRANVCALHAEWTNAVFDFDAYQQTLAKWLEEQGISIHLHKNGFLPHVTICRRPFSKKEWEDAFSPVPFYLSNFHLYESHPGLIYRPVWTFPILPPFDQTHAFGENEQQLAQNLEFARQYRDQFSSIPQIDVQSLPDDIIFNPHT